MADAQAHDAGGDVLAQALDTALEAGVQVQMSGGYTTRVYETMDAIATAMGAERSEGSVSSSVVGLTIHAGSRSLTAFRRTPHIGVNFSELSALSQLTRQAPQMSPETVATRLSDIRAARSKYPAALRVVMLGVACAAFAGLFEADMAGVLVAGLGGLVGAAVRHVMSTRRFKPFMFCSAAAFTSTSLVLWLAPATSTATSALAACVLYLVPGVPLLNGTSDLLATHYLNGLVRLTMSMVVVLASAIGVSLALGLWGLP